MARRLPHLERTELLARAIAQHGPEAGPPFPCPYLAGRMARNMIVVPSPMVPGIYHSLMDLNFRRLGAIFYRPACAGCEECRSIRVPVAEFCPSRAQRRCRARNADLVVEVAPPAPSEEKRHLYKRYLEERHDGQMDGSPSEFYGFLYASTVQTLEICYRMGDQLVGVGVVDVEPDAMSAVYFYFAPDLAPRSLGVFNVLWLVEECRRRGIAHLYLGYYVSESRKMSYKSQYRPYELLESDGRWTRRG
jgi:arginyl-tRNA--protein-N-Asp/Glu arginylyltransferase